MTNLKRRSRIAIQGDAIMDINEFEIRFPNEDKCFDYLYNLRWKNGYRCPRCHCDEMWEVSSYKYKCKNCQYQTTVTSGTLLQDTHIPIIKWFKAIWYVSQKGCDATAVELQEILDIGSYRTALNILNKIAFAKAHNVSPKLKGTVEISCYSMKINQKNICLAIAVEIINRKIGLVQIAVLTDVKTQLEMFVRKYVEQGSTIISNSWNYLTDLNQTKYKRRTTSVKYGFPYTRKIYVHFLGWLYNRKVKDTLGRSITTYCSTINSLKADISFDELLSRVIYQEPVPHVDNFYKKMMIK